MTSLHVKASVAMSNAAWSAVPKRLSDSMTWSPERLYVRTPCVLRAPALSNTRRLPKGE
jgi:hypothetical protein